MSSQDHFTDLNKLPISIRLGSYSSEFLYWGYFPAEYWRNYWHLHSFFEVCYAYQGSGLFRIGEQEYSVTAGDLFIARPGEPHEIISSTADPLGIYFWSYTLLPAWRSETDRRSQNLGLHQDVSDLLQTFSSAPSCVSRQTGPIPPILRQLAAEISIRRPGYIQKIHNLAADLVIDTARAVVQDIVAGVPLPESGDENVEKIVRYLNDNYDRPIRIRDVAAQLHMSERHTSRLFRRSMGITIQQFLVTLRISIAKQRLLDPTLSIAEIAHALGYSDARHFSTLFRKQTGLTPTDFRRRAGTLFLS